MEGKQRKPGTQAGEQAKTDLKDWR